MLLFKYAAKTQVGFNSLPALSRSRDYFPSTTNSIFTSSHRSGLAKHSIHRPESHKNQHIKIHGHVMLRRFYNDCGQTSTSQPLFCVTSVSCVTRSPPILRVETRCQFPHCIKGDLTPLPSAHSRRLKTSTNNILAGYQSLQRLYSEWPEGFNHGALPETHTFPECVY